ncbi:hypothetical protein F5B22DRAFT_641826 [Xylaria bambusicola]|uniref:uncharacterized protein n=1 Tax=Xylaria bambusicola TaxID=326684 RepID=UPI0020072C4C|nr:uncharacterized protein F5B22DRAFT_641826 [Xylaria bambusicola]KAI0526687.1 hypothetical protein F5B22DRAFT_641826 [Xylaria bambusicola]
MSSIVNKVKEAVSGHHDKSSAPEGTYGTHDSRTANAADPRIDSDRDHRAAPGSTVGGTHDYTTGNNYSHTGPTSGYSSGTTGAYGSSREGEYGPHGSRMANAADPRVDSDRDASRTVGGNNYGSSATHGTTGAYGSTGTYGSTGREGPHSSNMANKMDPRIDSDRSGQRMGNTAGDYYGSGREGEHGPHQSRLANAADPRVDSDRDASRTVGNTYGSSGTHGTTGAHGTHGATHGTHQLGGNYAPGPAPHTAGPHKSDAMNKADPRVDSDLDGSKTYGGNKTYGVDESRYNKDPTDAAQVPPSVLQETIGRPSVEHNDRHHNRERRHSLANQETHRGL